MNNGENPLKIKKRKYGPAATFALDPEFSGREHLNAGPHDILAEHISRALHQAKLRGHDKSKKGSYF